MGGEDTLERQKSKDYFRAEKLRTRTEKDYLMHLAEKPVMMELASSEGAEFGQ